MTISKAGLVAGSPQSLNTLVDRVDAAITQIAGISAAELGFIDGVTAGTAAASKAVVLDANSKINTLDITALKLNGTACDEAYLSGAAKVANQAAFAGATLSALAIDFNTLIASMKTAGQMTADA